VVGRSKLGCGLSPTLSFKDVHHPRWGGRRVEPGPYPPYGLVTHFFLQHSKGKGVHQSCGGGPWLHGAGRLQAVSCSVSGPLGLDGSGAASDVASCRLVGAWLPIHRTGDSRAMRGFATSMPSLPDGRTGGPYKTSYAAAVAAAFLDGLVLTPVGRTRARTPSCVLRQPPPIGAEVVAAAGEGIRAICR
jgi:hypothetical protein